MCDATEIQQHNSGKYIIVYVHTEQLTDTHIHLYQQNYYEPEPTKRKSENLLLHSNLNGFAFARVKETIFFFPFSLFVLVEKHHIIASSLEADSLFWVCVEFMCSVCVRVLGIKRKWGRRRHKLNIFISTIIYNNFVRHIYSPHKSLIYMGIWLYFSSLH